MPNRTRIQPSLKVSIVASDGVSHSHSPTLSAPHTKFHGKM